jgi:hypothetical protein
MPGIGLHNRERIRTIPSPEYTGAKTKIPGLLLSWRRPKSLQTPVQPTSMVTSSEYRP